MRSVTVLVLIRVSVTVKKPDSVIGFTLSMPLPGLEVVVDTSTSMVDVGSTACVVSTARVAVDSSKVTRAVCVEVTRDVALGAGSRGAVSLNEGNDGGDDDIVE
jgi:hypothetical protein